MENTHRIFAGSYIDVPISNAVASERAVDEGQPLVASAPKHKVAVAYNELAGEVLRRAGLC
jgi:cellulose biosynthesis protein BcsQ